MTAHRHWSGRTTQTRSQLSAPFDHHHAKALWQGDPTIAAASTLQIVIIGLLILVVQRVFRLRLMV